MPEYMTKQFFEKVAQMAKDWAELKHLFDMRVESKFGYHYSDKDFDEIIDSIDYGHGGLTWERFNEVMKEGKTRQ